MSEDFLSKKMTLVTSELIEQFTEHGFLVLPGFLSVYEVAELKLAVDQVLDEHCQSWPVSSFRTRSRDTYFAESGDKIRGFYEDSIVDPDGRLLVENPKGALNKVGHALHKLNPTFQQKTINSKVKEITKKLTDIDEPVVCQSMVIFKNPNIGGEVHPHQDATYLNAEPMFRKLIGFWIALDEATPENGCLHFLPGSHKPNKVYQRFVRNPDKESEILFLYRGESCPKPGEKKFVAAPAKPGDLVLIDGMVIHQSEPNRSDKRRMAYTFHVVDGKSKWSDENWIQPTEKGNFVKI